MNMPGFTAEGSLNELGAHYAMTPKNAFARGGLVIGQQLGGPLVPLERGAYLELDCPQGCTTSSSPIVTCGVFRVELYFRPARRTFLGNVNLPAYCWLPRCVR
jgi:hypothetical protein